MFWTNHRNTITVNRKVPGYKNRAICEIRKKEGKKKQTEKRKSTHSLQVHQLELLRGRTHLENNTKASQLHIPTPNQGTAPPAASERATPQHKRTIQALLSKTFLEYWVR